MSTRASTAGLRPRLAGHRGTKILLAAAGAAALAATIMSGPVGGGVQGHRYRITGLRLRVDRHDAF